MTALNMGKSNIKLSDSAWKNLYKIGGAAALIATVLFLSDIIVLLTGSSMPVTAIDFFTLLQNDRLSGLLELFFTDIFGLALYCPLFLALHLALRQTDRESATLATILAFIGIALALATYMGYSMVYLGDQYAAATTDAERTLYLAAGEAVLATSQGSGFHMAGLFIEGAAVVISIVMLRSPVFDKITAYVGILGHGLDVGHTLINLIFIPLIGLASASAVSGPLLAIGGTFQLVWLALVGRRLFQLGQESSRSGAE